MYVILERRLRLVSTALVAVDDDCAKPYGRISTYAVEVDECGLARQIF
jgi:hypothetical protein